MSTRHRCRISNVLACCIIGMAIVAAAEQGPAGDCLVGIVNDNGTFLSKATVSQTASSITFTKTDPKERLGTLEIRFLPVKEKTDFSPRHLFLQWEKQHGPGKLWAVVDQKSFDKRENVYLTTWNESPSLTIIDKSGGNIFRRRDWDRVIRVKVNGKELLRQPPQRKARESATPWREPAPAYLLAGTEDENNQAAESVVPEVVHRIPSRSASEVHGLWDDSARQYENLLKRTAALEESLESIRTWFVLGPVTVLALVGLCMGMAWFVPSFRQALRQSPRLLSASRGDSEKFGPDLGFRNTG